MTTETDEAKSGGQGGDWTDFELVLVKCSECQNTYWRPEGEPPDDNYNYWQCPECGYVKRGG